MNGTDRRRAGVIALATDLAIEDELHAFARPSGLSLVFTRVPSSNAYDLSTLGAIATHIDQGSYTLPPGEGIDVIAYGCTSGTIAAGEATIHAILDRSRPGTPSTNPVTASRLALQAMGAQSIGLLTPYPAPVHDAVAAAFAEQFAIVHSRGLDIGIDSAISAVSTERIIAEAAALSAGVDALFLSCTSLRVADAIPAIEASTGCPVVSSNQALAWHLLSLAGLPVSSGVGRLMEGKRHGSSDRARRMA